MKKKFYYSLVLAMCASSMLTSCTKDDDTTGEPPLYDITEKPAVEQFAVTVSINGGSPVALKTFDKGASTKVNLDKLQQDFADVFRGYEILGVTQNGAEAKGEVEINSNTTFNIEALKVAVVSDGMPEDGKMLHSKTDNLEVFAWKVADKKLTYIGKKSSTAKEAAPETKKWVAESSAMTFVYGDGGLISMLQPTIDNLNIIQEAPVYLLRVDNQYRLIQETIFGERKRLAKLDKTVKGFETKWVSEEIAGKIAEAESKLADAEAKKADAEKAIADAEKAIAEAEKENADATKSKEDKEKAEKTKAEAEAEIVTATAGVESAKDAGKNAVRFEINAGESEYVNGVIKIGDTKYLYDGTYLYELIESLGHLPTSYDIEDMPKFDIKNFNAGTLVALPEDEVRSRGLAGKVEGDRNVYVKSGRIEGFDNLLGFTEVFDEKGKVTDYTPYSVVKLNKLDFGFMSKNVVLFPDMTIAILSESRYVNKVDELGKVMDYFIDGDYLAYVITD